MLFKASLNTNLEEIRQYLSVSQSGSFDKIKPHIAAAEILYIKDILGEELYNVLNEYYNSFTGETKPPVDPVMEAILPLTQNALINFAYYVGADEMSVHITDAGIQLITDETHKQAFQWQIEQAKASWLSKGYLFSDILLTYLEEHCADFPTWKASPAYTQLKDCLLYTTTQFNEVFHIRNSRRLFLSLKPIIRSIESKFIVPTVSQLYYDDLLVNIRGNKLTPDDKLILARLRPAIAHYSMAEAITRFSVDVFPEGVYSNLVSSFGTIQAKNPTNKVDKALAVDSLNRYASTELQSAQEFLDANASQYRFTIYFNSSSYHSPSSENRRAEFLNSKDKGILLL